LARLYPVVLTWLDLERMVCYNCNAIAVVRGSRWLALCCSPAIKAASQIHAGRKDGAFIATTTSLGAAGRHAKYSATISSADAILE